ncbi:TRAP transporter substrate-binding protein DctP [Sulfitobacter aestuariivivens]|uniref:TRAP transporter substrate-binding protein DctP n=1 Tax=Sulfitobacter aestuariivivens TaxID=2766981 RepID=A0A927HFK9_9RHOB|nr:TRAP transporter substrate-binding protein DctP [Sulfitobacter aestuariivivens]MBD3664539.1 TRAP transporter substrate-binding protein DctP [Sulfitobacter aestuariivivens]
MKMFDNLSFKLTGAVAALAMTASSGWAEDRVSAVHAFPEFLVYTKTFLAMVDDINARGEGIVQIEVRGGPEAIGMFQQPAAVRDGIVDMVHTPGSFYGANVPEIDAMVAATVTPLEARANGGAEAMDAAHQSRFGVKHLGWIDGGVKFHIYTSKEPVFDDNGVLDLTGVKLRDNPIYHAFFEALNATTASMPATEVYAALEKGVVDAAAWTEIGLMDLKWDEFMKFAIEPPFYNTDIGVIFNKESWDALTPESRELIQSVVIEWEEKSYNDRQTSVTEDRAELEKRGMQFVTMSDEASANYLKMASDAAWARMEGRLKEMGDDGSSYETMRKLYHP